MNIEVLHIDDCPSWVEAGSRLRDALRGMGLDDAGISYRLVRNADDAERLHFAGSPTMLLDGIDMFPDAERTRELACRVYVTPTGMAGVPTTEQLIDAIARHGR